MTIDEAINELIQCYSLNSKTAKKKNEAISMAIEALEKQRWIPISEKLPDKGQIVLWCNEYGSVFTSTITARKGDSWAIGKRHRSSEIIAWMPLPEPYKGKRKGADE